MLPELCPRCGSGEVTTFPVERYSVKHCICNTCLEEWVE